jgi:hypothetical protein
LEKIEIHFFYHYTLKELSRAAKQKKEKKHSIFEYKKKSGKFKNFMNSKNLKETNLLSFLYPKSSLFFKKKEKGLFLFSFSFQMDLFLKKQIHLIYLFKDRYSIQLKFILA